MNTTTDTAAPFTPNAVYSVPSLSIRYPIEFNSDRTQARLLDGEHVTEWLPVTQTHIDDNNGGWLTDSVIDANGYAIPVSACQDVPQIKRHARRIYFRVMDNQTGRYMCSGYNCRSLADLKKSMLSYFSIDHDESELKAISKDFVPYLDAAGFSIECEERFRPFPKSHVYN